MASFVVLTFILGVLLRVPAGGPVPLLQGYSSGHGRPKAALGLIESAMPRRG